jgi:plastocyanin
MKHLLALLATLSFAFLLPVMAERAEPREIVIVTRDMAFFVDGNPEPNPPIHVKAGEEIAFSFRNEEAGMAHDFSIATWGAATRTLKGAGRDRLLVTAPSTRGTAEYSCRPHSKTMRGRVLIE